VPPPGIIETAHQRSALKAYRPESARSNSIRHPTGDKLSGLWRGALALGQPETVRDIPGFILAQCFLGFSIMSIFW
jgi:hypothetical protein